MAKKRARKTPNPNQMAFNILREVMAKHDPGAVLPTHTPDIGGKHPAAEQK